MTEEDIIRATNEPLAMNAPSILSMLSSLGKKLYYPKNGLLIQAEEARKTKLNASVGIAREDDGSIVHYSSIDDEISMSAEKAVTYASSYGLRQLRLSWKNQLELKNPTLSNKCVSLPVVCNAITHGLFIAGQLFVDPADELIIPSLNWPNYKLIFAKTLSAKISLYEMFNQQQKFNVEALEEQLLTGANKKIIIFNFPHNPTGYSLSRAETEQTVKMLETVAEQGKHLVVLCDDAYWGLSYEKGLEPQSIFAQLSAIHENILAIKLDGATKEDFFWGLRVGFISFANRKLTGAEASILAEKAAALVRATISNNNHLSQELLLSILENPQHQIEKKQKKELMQNRYKLIKEILSRNQKWRDYFVPLPFNSGYFFCIKLQETAAESLRLHLLKHYDTGLIALNKDIIRIAYSSVATRQLPTILENIYMACKDLAKT